MSPVIEVVTRKGGKEVTFNIPRPSVVRRNVVRRAPVPGGMIASVRYQKGRTR